MRLGKGKSSGGDVFSVGNETSRVRLSVTLTETNIPASAALEFSYVSHVLASRCGRGREGGLGGAWVQTVFSVLAI